MRELRPRQKAAIEDLRRSLKEGYFRIVLQGATGFGKTLLSAAIIEMVLRRCDKKIIFAVPSINLVNQAANDFYAEGLTDIGIMQSNHPATNPDARIQIACCATLKNRDIPEFDILFHDECHERQKIITEIIHDPKYARTPVIGLSATPWAVGMANDYNRLIVAGTTAEGISEGWLCPYRAFNAPIDLSGVSVLKTKEGKEYNQKSLSETVSKPKIVGDIIGTWFRLGEGRSTFAFCVDRAHAKEVQKGFINAGVNAAYQDCNTGSDERTDILEKFTDGEYRIICSVNTLKRGIDADVRCIIDAHPVISSPIALMQGFGRGLRNAEGKDDLIYLDHAGNLDNWGRPENIHFTELFDGTPQSNEKKYARIKKPNWCVKCSFLQPSGAIECPNCGYVPQSRGRFEIANGELQEYNGSSSRRKRVTNGESMLTRQQWYSQLLGVAVAMGRKEGWAAHVYKDKFGCWPNYLRKEAMRPSFEVCNYCRNRDVRQARAMSVKRTYKKAMGIMSETVLIIAGIIIISIPFLFLA